MRKWHDPVWAKVLLGLVCCTTVTEAVEIISAPYLRTCEGRVHAWVYTRGASGVFAPGVSCLPEKCLTPEAIKAKVQELLLAPSPSDAASVALSTLDFSCTQDVEAEDTPRGALCRERDAFVSANVQAATGLDPFRPGPEPTCALPPPPAPVYTWFVKFNSAMVGSPNTSPVYDILSGARKTVANGHRVEWKVPCDPSKGSFPSGASKIQLYAPFGPAFSPSEVALCTLYP